MRASILAPLVVLAVYALALRVAPADLHPGARLAARGPTEAELHDWALEKRRAMREERWSDARGTTERLLGFMPTDPTLLGDLARIEHALGNDAAEAAAWERFIAVAPVPVHACPDVAFAYRRLERPEDYLRACERCLSFDAKNSDNLFCVGHASERMGDLERAREHYARGLEVAPQYADLSLGLARVAHRQGRFADAERHAREALESRPGDREAEALLARLRNGGPR